MIPHTGCQGVCTALRETEGERASESSHDGAPHRRYNPFVILYLNNNNNKNYNSSRGVLTFDGRHCLRAHDSWPRRSPSPPPLKRGMPSPQVVDARDPLLYRSTDLEAFARELHHTKSSVLLLNKADLLSKALRTAWADYFDRQGISYLFWSAKAASEGLAGVGMPPPPLPPRTPVLPCSQQDCTTFANASGVILSAGLPRQPWFFRLFLASLGLVRWWRQNP